jgi:hypothetical protein
MHHQPTDRPKLTKDPKEFQQYPKHSGKHQDYLGQEEPGNFSGLWLMMVLGAIEGFTNSKADRSPTAPDSTPTIESQPLMESLHSLVVSEAAVSVRD